MQRGGDTVAHELQAVDHEVRSQVVPGPLHSLIALAKRDTDAALARARSDGHAGNRCHYLAWIAHFAEDRRVVAIARESLAACEEIPNEYSRVQLSAWPLHALAERGMDRECMSALPGVIDRVGRLANPVNRLDALEQLLHGIFPVEPARRLVLDELIAACRAASSWKAPRCLARTAMLLGSAPDDLARVLAAQPEGPHRRQAERVLATGGAHPRRFFTS